MPIADLPYRISRLEKEGQYAYLTRAVSKTADTPSNRIRVLRNVTLCDGPTLWDTIKLKDEPYKFFVKLRLFATRSMVDDYLTSPELISYAKATNQEIPKVEDGDLIIGEEEYLTPESVEITKAEYKLLLDSKNGGANLDSLEEMVCQIRGIDSLDSIVPPRRGRKPKAQAMKTVSSAPVISESETEERPAQTAGLKTKKKRNKTNLRDQFVAVQSTPSRVIDVSGFGDTMQNQRGKILDRVRHGERISQCVSLDGLFPVISDNVPAFVRAMTFLGSRYTSKIAEFKTLHSQKSRLSA